jgi:hypothetical protein
MSPLVEVTQYQGFFWRTPVMIPDLSMRDASVRDFGKMHGSNAVFNPPEL